MTAPVSQQPTTLGPPVRLPLPDVPATKRVGRLIGDLLPPQAICLLTGDLAAGKTTLAKAVCGALGIDPHIVISPTYTLTNIYPGTPSVFHVDLYRIQEPEALYEMDIDDWINPDGVTLVEWPQVARDLLANWPTLRLVLSHGGADEGPERGRAPGRELIAAAIDADYAPVIGALARYPGARPLAPPFPEALWYPDATGRVPS